MILQSTEEDLELVDNKWVKKGKVIEVKDAPRYKDARKWHHRSCHGVDSKKNKFGNQKMKISGDKIDKVIKLKADGVTNAQIAKDLESVFRVLEGY